MNNRIIKIISIFSSILLVMLASEWLFAYLSQQQLLKTLTVEQQMYQSEEMPAINLTEIPESDYADLVDRPLFVHGRHPVAQGIKQGSQGGDGLAVSSQNLDWQLVGVYTQDTQLMALMNRNRTKMPKVKDNYKRLRVGDTLDGWELAEIKSDRIVLRRDSEQKELLLRKPKPKEIPKNSVAEGPTPEQQTVPESSSPDTLQSLEQPLPEPPEESENDPENNNAHF